MREIAMNAFLATATRSDPSSADAVPSAWAVWDGQQLVAVSLDCDAAREAASALRPEGKHGRYRRVALLPESKR